MNKLTQTQQLELSMTLIILESWDYRTTAMLEGVENGVDVLAAHQRLMGLKFPKMFGGK